MRRVLAVVLALAASVCAQTNRGAISGTVFDPSGASIPGATVVITNLGTNQVWKLTTSSTGTYSAVDLEPVEYRVEAESPGFSKSIIERIKVDTASTASGDITLQPGAVGTQVSVTAEAPAVNTESGTTGSTITERQIMDTPLANRSVLDLAVLAPNITGDVGSENPAVTSGATVPGYNLSINGGRPGSTAILADGVNNTGVGLARAVVTFSPETVQEFTIQTSAYSAEYGQTGGGVINATTKSGTNRLTGTAMWLQRNPALNAAPFTTATVNRPVSNLRDNQMSLSGGGPVVIPKLYNGRNRTFFFGAIEPRRRQDHIQADSLLPTEAMRNGDFSGLSAVAGGWAPTDVVQRLGVRTTGDTTIYQQFNPVGNQLQFKALATGQTAYTPFPGNVIPKTLLDPVAIKALQYLPTGGDYYINSNGQLVNWNVQRFVKQNEERYLLRLDHTITQSNRINFRTTQIPAIGQKGFGSEVNGNGADYSFSRQIMMADTHTFTPTMFNDLRLNYTRGRFSGTFTPEFDVKTGRNLTKELGLPSLTEGGLPMFAFGLSAFGNIGSQGSTLNDNVEERYNLSDIFYIVKGSMSIKVGVDLTIARMNVTPLYAASGGNYSFNNLQTNSLGTTSGTGGIAFATFLLGVPNTVAQRNVIIPYYYRWNSGAGFIQNDWKVRSNLTLNIGLRYSLQMPRTEKYNHQGVFRPDLAKDFALPAPTPLADGRVLTSASVVPFAFSGMGGRSKYLYDPQYMDFEPRFGFAWNPRFLRGMVVRGGYGLSHAPLTGNNRLPNPDFGAPLNFTATSGAVDSNYWMRLGSNPPLITPQPVDQYLNIPSDGLAYMQAINYPGFVVSQNNKTPYSQNWNMTMTFQLPKRSTVEVAYVGNKGTHLFLPSINVNPRPFDYVNLLDAQNLNPDTTVADPLGRRDTAGRVIQVPRATLASTYMGVNALNTFYDAAANSIRHATYVNFVRRAGDGLTVMANYTFAKSIDDASDASPDKNVLTTGTVGGGQMTSGGTRKGDRSVSSFDVKHNMSSTFLYDLPFGPRRRFLPRTWAPLAQVIGGWTVSGVFRVQSGYPAVATLSDANYLGGPTHTIRPDIVPGVPLKNPLWSANCPVGNTCEPYLNPAAFMRPARGQLGTAPRSLDSVRGPVNQYFDASVQKNFSIGERRRLQFRVDLINALNHPVFRMQPNNGGGTDLWSAPSTNPVTAAEYDTWARLNNQPLSTTASGAALLAQSQALITGSRSATGALPNNFFTVSIPQTFFGKDANSYDIRTMDGLKLYRLRQSWTNGGGLYAPAVQRYLQFGVKFYF